MTKASYNSYSSAGRGSQKTNAAVTGTSFAQRSDASQITSLHQALICCALTDVVWRRMKITDDSTVTTLRTKCQGQVLSRPMIRNETAVRKTFPKNRSDLRSYSHHAQ